MLKKILLIVGIIICVSSFSNRVFATPTLGVAVNGGTYAYTDPDALTDEYINYFAGSVVSAVGEYEGFIIPASGSDLTVFTSYDPSSIDIYFVASMAADYRPISFAGTELINMGDTGQADGYKPLPYYGLNLNYLLLTDWTEHTFEGSKTFYLYEAPVTYEGALSNLPLNFYFFAAANINETAGLQFASTDGIHDDFSPKTTSAGGHTPEPATMLLFGMGALGFGIMRKRRKF